MNYDSYICRSQIDLTGIALEINKQLSEITEKWRGVPEY
jgi:hypothetical protein